VCHGVLRVLTDGFNPGEMCSIEHAQDSLVQACAVVLIGVSGIGYDGQQKELFVTLMDGSYLSI
jgi:hypothetical protein